MEEARDFLNKKTDKPEEAKNMDAIQKGVDLFFGDKEQRFFDGLGKEVVNDIVKESFLLYKIDYKKTKTHSLYGESKNKVFQKEVQIFGLINVEVDPPEYMAPGGILKKGFGKLTAEIFNSHLEELQVKIMMGDFMYSRGHYYEVIDDGSSNISNEFAYVGDRLFSIKIVGVRVKNDMFNAR